VTSPPVVAPAAPRYEDAPARPANFLLLVVDVACWAVGMAFLDAQTVLPRLVELMGGGPVVLGVLLALRQVGYWGPQLLVAQRLQNRDRYLPFLLRVCAWGRAPMLAAAVVIALFGGRSPALALAALVIAYGMQWAGDGAGGVPWTAIVGRTIAAGQRGRFFATTQVVSGIGRIGVGLLIAQVFAGRIIDPFPAGAALLVLLAALLLGVSWAALALLREPPVPAAERSAAADRPAALPLGAYLRALPVRLRARPDIGRLALVQGLGGALAATGPFYGRLAQGSPTAPLLPAGVEGRFLISVTLGALVCAPLWGWMTDRYGPRAALFALACAALLSPLVATAGWVAPAGGGLITFYAAYFLLGSVIEGGWAVFTSYLLEAVPGGSEQPVYIGLLSILNVPAALLLPLGAGALVQAFGPLTLLAPAVVLLVAALALVRGLPDTRRAAAVE